VADRLHSAAIHLLRRLRRHDVSSGLTGARLSALSVVVFGGPITLGDLAAAEQVKAPTMTRMVQALEDDGLLRRETDPGDRRVVRVRATAKGVRLLEEGRERRVSDLEASLRELDAEELDVLGRSVELLERVLTKPSASPPSGAVGTSGTKT
jgi:DNA-binding MarR family transcriptional regulator